MNKMRAVKNRCDSVNGYYFFRKKWICSMSNELPFCLCFRHPTLNIFGHLTGGLEIDVGVLENGMKLATGNLLVKSGVPSQ